MRPPKRRTLEAPNQASAVFSSSTGTPALLGPPGVLVFPLAAIARNARSLTNDQSAVVRYATRFACPRLGSPTRFARSCSASLHGAIFALSRSVADPCPPFCAYGPSLLREAAQLRTA